jgi:hypothetical protein
MTAGLIAVGATAAAVALIEKLPALAGIWAKDRQDRRAKAKDMAALEAKAGEQ